MHPNLETLIRCRDHELPPEREAAIHAHVAECDSCRMEYHRLCWQLGQLRTQTPGDLGLLAGIRSKIRNWETARSTKEWRATMRVRVLEEIGPFLGSNGAQGLLEPVSEEGSNLLSTIEPVLADFLGDRAASQLVSRVAEAAIVRI